MPLQQQQSVNQHLFKRLIELFLSVVLRAVILRQIVESTISWANSEQLNYFMRSFFFFLNMMVGLNMRWVLSELEFKQVAFERTSKRYL